MKQNENTKYVKLGITGAAVLAFGFAIMYILNQSKNIAAGIQLVFNILKPFLYGALIAYLLAPICNQMDERFLKWFPKATEKQKKGLKNGVAACTKHFLGYGGGSSLSWKEIYEEVLLPHEAMIRQAGC